MESTKGPLPLRNSQLDSSGIKLHSRRWYETKVVTLPPSARNFKSPVAVREQTSTRGGESKVPVGRALCSLLSALCCLLSALCSLLSALRSLLYALCSMLSALCSMLSALCCLLYALCSMLSALCSMLYALGSLLCALCCLLSAVCSLLSALCSVLYALCSMLSALCSLLYILLLSALSQQPQGILMAFATQVADLGTMISKPTLRSPTRGKNDPLKSKGRWMTSRILMGF